MIKPVYTTNPVYIKYLDCNPAVYRRIGFQSCNLDIKEGSNVLSTISLCDFKLESLGNSDLGGCGGSLKKNVTLNSSSTYTLTASEIGQAQGEVQMIVVKVTYQKNHLDEDRLIYWEYKGNTYPLKDLMILTGRTQPEIPWQGWDLGYYSNNPPIPPFSPQVYPVIASPDLTFGGIMFSNPSNTYNTELEIFVFN
jgi:hypothetical protein